MHAFLLINSDPIQFAKKQNAKVVPFILQKIEDARELKKFVKFSFSEKTAILIENIDTTTPETSNAFLKNLEEPTKNIIYILTAENLSNVLPTIVSRCEVVRTQDIGYRIYDKDINYKDALNIKDREEAIKFIENLIYIDHEKQIFENMENYLNTINNLKANGNVSLQLTNLVVRMESHGRQI
ncbi:MAG: DNA polymerase III, delta prime subunit [uncultured bacterium]|nr:MAG: DNA polymerase III, delta prime subunit [uncultured bacterium]